MLAVLAGILAFEALDIPIFSAIGLPHEICYVQQPKLVWLHVVSDLLIGVAYVSISCTLGYLVFRASRDIPFHWVFLAFGLFIISCGLTHFMEVWVVWQPVYWLSGYAKVVTAAASIATAIVLFPLVPKVFAMIAAARESEARRAEIERLNSDLERFNYSAAHDLRAPLRSITGFSDVLREDFSGHLPPEAHQYLDRIRRSAEKMDTLVTSLLRYATIGRQAVEMTAVPLEPVVSAVVAALEHDIEERAATIRVGSLPSVRGDETLLQLVFQNLIGNAVKYVAEGKKAEVEISGQVEGAEVVLYVDDNGIGFPIEAQGRIFGMFERFHAQHAGTGIGLAIVHRAIERMHGSIAVEARPTGGSRFTVRLPHA